MGRPWKSGLPSLLQNAIVLFWLKFFTWVTVRIPGPTQASVFPPAVLLLVPKIDQDTLTV
jgi:hypothetical protein